ncbi:MAG: RnfABCDGE type electron transport complex subunit D [Actinobacteria bacterium]|nr:MAG: RnfABCDGE type electron transport complex subunit D [Actinomycetota bacterium]
MDNNLIVSTSPHIRDPINTRRIMCQVIAALAPVTIYALVIHGLPALWVLLASIAGALLGEFVMEKGRRMPVTLDDCSALLTGLLLALTLPPLLPWWIAGVGGLMATILGKQIFGGIGHNLFNPALVGRAVVFVSWPAYFAAGYAKSAAIGIANTATHKSIEAAVDIVNGASPLAAMKTIYDGAAKAPQGLFGSSYYRPLLFSNPWGCLGEVSAILLVLGGVYLVVTRVIDWRIPVVYLGTVVCLTAVSGRDPLFYTLAGGLLIGAIFMATDYTTSPLARRGKIVYGVGLGVVTWLLRGWSNNPEGVMFAILFMNALVPLIDRYILPRRYGQVKKAEEVAQA